MKQYKNKKIIILSDQPKDRISGPNTVIMNIFPFLDAKLDIKWKVCPGLGVFKIKILPSFVKSFLSGLVSFFVLLSDKDIREAEIINAHGISSWLPAIWLSKLLGKTSLITFHETYEYTKLRWFFGGGKTAQWVWGYAIKNADCIIDVSNTIKSQKAFFIPNGVDSKKFTPKKAEKRKKAVLYVGRLSEEKGVEYFLKACKIIKKHFGEEVKFLVATNTDTKNSERSGMANLLRDGGIEFVDEKKDLALIYSMADVLIVPSIYEAFGLVNLEAMSCGVPVVASNVGGIPNVVKDGVVGFLVPSGDSEVIAEKAIKILENDDLREKLRKNCLEWVKNFNWENTAKQYFEVYQRVLSGHKENKNLENKNLNHTPEAYQERLKI